MYHYTDSGLSYVYLTNGFSTEVVDDEEFVGIDNVHDLHRLIGKNIIAQLRPITSDEFRFIRIELNISQKALGKLLGVDSQTVARWEKAQTVIPRTTDVALRALYVESIDEESQVGFFLTMLSNTEIETAMAELYLEEKDHQWCVA